MKKWTGNYRCWFGALALMLITGLLFGCGGGDGPTAPPPSSQASTPVSVGNDGTTTTAVTLTIPDGSGVIVIDPGTQMQDQTGAPVTGDLTLSVTTYTDKAKLPPGAADSINTLFIGVDITITNEQKKEVKKLGKPFKVKVKLPNTFTEGQSVEYFSFDGTNWVKEGTATVENGHKVELTLTHLSTWGVKEDKTTGTGSGGNGNNF